MSPDQRYLLDVNVLIALLDELHVHNRIARQWFDVPGRKWALCPITETGFLRIATSPSAGMSLDQAEALLELLTQESGFHYQQLSGDWRTLAGPIRRQIHGHRQVTDAWLLGTALQAGLTLVTFDRAMLHLAGEHRGSVLLLEA